MKKAKLSRVDELRPEYKRSDFGEIVRGKYARRRKASSRGRTQTGTSRRVKSSKQPHGIRQPIKIARELGLDGPLIAEKTVDGVLFRKDRLSWEETAQQMAQSAEDWSDFDITAADGLNGNR